jgi:hypothetical protein
VTAAPSSNRSALDPGAARPPRRPVVFDPGWLFLLAGIGVLGSTILLPAIDQLNHARWLRDRARVIEHHRLERIARHEEFLGALKEQDATLSLNLAASQLNQIPADRTPLTGDQLEQPAGGASVFPALEPDPIDLPREVTVDSTLHRLVTGERTRSWMIVIGAVLILIGLLPQGRGAVPQPR